LLLNDPVPKPRISAARSLGRVAGREVIPHLKNLMKDQNQSLRATAAGAIARILSTPPQT
jgi:HEAT repeat protein